MRSTVALTSAFLLLAVAITASTITLAQTAKPAKPAKHKPAKSPVLGTSQLAGNDGVIGTEYTIGKENPMNIAVTKVEYRADRVRTGNAVISPNAGEKLLVIHFAFHNPNKQERGVSGGTFRFTAVDAAGANHDHVDGVWNESNGEVLDILLKPGQKMPGYTAIRLPAKGDIEKILIVSVDDKAVRYALKGKVTPLPAPYADAADKIGTSAIETIPAKIGEVLVLPATSHHGEDPFDLTIEKAEYSDMPILEEAPEEGKRFVIVSFAVKNASPTAAQLFQGDSLRAVVATADGEAVSHTGRLLHVTHNREFQLMLPKDGMSRGRIWFVVPKDVKLKSLTIRGHNDDDRPFVLDISKAL